MLGVSSLVDVTGFCGWLIRRLLGLVDVNALLPG